MKKFWFLLLLSTAIFASLPDGARYLIITPPDFVDALEPLAEWKTAKGYYARIVTTEETGTSSTDIRSYIISAYETWETPPEFILLAGTASEIPMIYGGRTSYGSFNSDWKYGELTGDLFTDVYVGRLPANNVDRMERMVDKVISYERTPLSGDWIKKGTTILRNDYDSSDSAYSANIDSCAAGMSRWDFTEIDTFDRDCCNASMVEASVNEGRSFVVYRGQGTTNWWGPFAVDPEYNLSNGYMLPVVLSITCHTISTGGSAQAGTWWMRGNSSEMSGAVAFYGTTSTISHGAEVRGELAEGFAASYFADTTNDLGKPSENAKLNMYSIYGDTAQYTSHLLLGDPEMDIRTDLASELIVDYPSIVDLGATEVNISVSDGSTGVENALVCIYQRDIHYAWGYTDGSGNISLPFETTEPGTLMITATAKNAIPFEGTTPVFPEGPFLNVVEWSMSDILGGNGDGRVNPGESIDLTFEIANVGTESAYAVSGVLTTDDPYAAVTVGTRSFGAVASDGSTTNDTPFTVEIAGDIPRGHRIDFDIELTTTGEDPWLYNVEGPSAELPRLTVISTSIVDTMPYGDGDGLPEPGEMFFMDVTVENDDILSLRDLDFELSISYEHTHIFEGHFSTDTLLAAARTNNTDSPFFAAVGPNQRPTGMVSAILYVTGDAGSFTYSDSIPFSFRMGGDMAGGFTGPDGYGYVIYDDTDYATGLAPTYDWLEINAIGSPVPGLTDADDEISSIICPFPVQFYGHETETLSICTNGFVAVGRESWSGGSGVHEQPIPQVGEAKGFIAAFWDDMDLRTWGDMYSYHDEVNNRFIVEFDDVALYGGALIHSFQVIFRDRTAYPTPTDDTEIIIQYNTLTDVRYCTVGIENYSETDGIQYVYHNEYADGASELVPTRTLLITTNSPTIPDTLWPEIMSITGTDEIAGDMNGMADAGEEYHILVDVENLGGISAPAVLCTMDIATDELSPVVAGWNLGDMDPGSTRTCTLSVIIPEDLEDTTQYTVSIEISSAGIGRSLPFTFTAYPSACTEYTWNLTTGWNIVSYPSTEGFPSDSLYSDAVPPVYDYSSGAYNAVDTVTAGPGYWVLMPSDVDIPQCLGASTDTVNYSLIPGWNLVGTGDMPISIDLFTEVEEIVWPIYGFTGGAYSEVDTLLPLKGYWILSSDSVSIP